MSQTSAPIAILGGSGFYEMPGLSDIEELRIDTPYGTTSDPLRRGLLHGQPVVFIARHGRGHSLLPGELPQRANFWALASLGVREVLSISAVGSLQQPIEPLHAVIPDQIIDRTNGSRPATFFGDGVVAHVSFDEPFCPRLSGVFRDAAVTAGATVHNGGTLVVIEGPAFSTRAESRVYQSWNGSIIGMTALPEAKLAREAGICYAMLACVTDYDTWHPDHKSVTVDLVLENLQRNAAMAARAVTGAVQSLPQWAACTCSDSLKTALVTPLQQVSEQRRNALRPILDRYGAC